MEIWNFLFRYELQIRKLKCPPLGLFHTRNVKTPKPAELLLKLTKCPLAPLKPWQGWFHLSNGEYIT